MLMIRFQRIGRTNDPAFRIAVLEKERAAKAGNIVELLGTYNPRSKALTLNEESVKAWLAKGAQPTDSIKNLLINKGVIEGKKVNALPKKTPQVDEAKVAAEAAAAKAAADAAAAAKAAEEAAAAAPTTEAEAAPELPTEAEVEAEAEPAAEEVSAAAEEAAEPAAEETPAA
ncbi:MAG: 30S ribosomal protein S16 [Candidatus Paceibacterota bacterium]|jgi:small subunit ribosomal protein S16